MTTISPTATDDSSDTLTKAERTRRTRALLIETALSCIARYGYAKTSLKLIAEEAGVSRGPLHYHYKDKNELMGEAAEALPLLISSETTRRLAMARTIEERMETMIDLGIDQHLGDHHIVACELLMATRQDPDLARSVLPHLSAAEEAIDARWIEYAKELGWSNERLVVFRRLFVAALRGLAFDHIEYGSEMHASVAAMLKQMFIGFLGVADSGKSIPSTHG
jgi:AcrR family transcriptional regulator